MKLSNQRRSTLGLACVFAAACGASHSDSTTHAAGARPSAGNERAASCERASPPSTALAERFEALGRQLSSDGVRYNGILAAGFITHGTGVTTPIDIPSGACVSIMTLASPSIHDVDAHLFNPDGEIIVEDVEPDPHPTVQLCATEARRVYHVIETYVSDQNATEGHGAYAIATFTSDRHGLDIFAHLVGGRPGTALSTSVAGTDSERRLSELRDGIARRGFTPTGELMHAQFAAQGSLRFPVPVSPDKCYTLAAIAEGTLTDTDLSVYDSDGEEIARDIRPDRDAFVQLCPAATQTLLVEVRARPGPGSVLLQPFSADAASVGGANTLWLGERVAWAASATPLPQAIESVRQAILAQGFHAIGTPVAETFAPGESREQRLTLEPGHCTAIAEIGGRGLGRTDLLVLNRAGDFLARGVVQGPAAVAVLCPSSREEVTARMRTEVGSGDGSLLTFEGPATPTWGAGLDRTALSEVLATQLATVTAGWRSDAAPERFRIGARAVRTHDVELSAGTCTRYAVSAGTGLPEVELTLRSASGQSLAQGTGSGTAIVTRCVSAAEHVRLEATIDPPGATEYDAVWARYVRVDRTTTGH